MGTKLSNSNGIVIILSMLQKPCTFTSMSTWINLLSSQNLSAHYRNLHLVLSCKSQAGVCLREPIHIQFWSRVLSTISKLRPKLGSSRVQSRTCSLWPGTQSGPRAQLGEPFAPSIPHIWRHGTMDHEVIELSTDTRIGKSLLLKAVWETSETKMSRVAGWNDVRVEFVGARRAERLHGLRSVCVGECLRNC